MATVIFFIHKITKHFGNELPFTSLILCGLLALGINFLLIFAAPFLTNTYYCMVIAMVIFAAIGTTCYNGYVVHRKAHGLGHGLLAGIGLSLSETASSQQDTDSVSEEEDANAAVATTANAAAETVTPAKTAAMETAAKPESVFAAILAEAASDEQSDPPSKATVPDHMPAENTAEPVHKTAAEETMPTAAEPEALPVINIFHDVINKTNDILAETDKKEQTAEEPAADVVAVANAETSEPEPIAVNVNAAVDTKAEAETVMTEDIAADEEAEKTESLAADTASAETESTVSQAKEDKQDKILEVIAPELPMVITAPSLAAQLTALAAQPEEMLSAADTVDGADIADTTAQPAFSPQLEDTLSAMDSMDQLLDYAFELGMQQPEQALQAYAHTLNRFREDSYAPFIVIEMTNIYKRLGQYTAAMQCLDGAMDIPAIQNDTSIRQQFSDSRAYLAATAEVLQQEKAGNIPFSDIPQELVTKIEAVYAGQAIK